jgi:DNA-binding CsgD family transcriptional regulator
MDAVVDALWPPELRNILQVVDSLYAAACGQKSWQQTVAEICQVGKLDGCALSMIDRLERRRVVVASHGLTCQPEPDPMLGPMPSSQLATDSLVESLGAFWRDWRIRSEALATSTLCWTDWTQPDGLVSWACAICSDNVRQTGCLDLYAAAGRGSRCPELGGLLWLLAPHVSRAWDLGMTSRSTVEPGPMPSFAPQCACHTNAPASDLDGLPDAIRLRAEFGLTRAEARLALCLARGWSLATAAEAFEVKLTTIRSQLQQVFSKTGTSRQAECVAMLLSRGYGSQRALGLPTKATQLGGRGRWVGSSRL